MIRTYCLSGKCGAWVGTTEVIFHPGKPYEVKGKINKDQERALDLINEQAQQYYTVFAENKLTRRTN